jgi:hypothetical protein
MKVHLGRHRGTVWNFENKECLGKFFVLRDSANRFRCCYFLLCLYVRQIWKVTKIFSLHEEVIFITCTNICKALYTLSVKMSDFTVWRHTWRKNKVNCAVLTGNSAGLRTLLSSRLSHRELRSSLRESHSFLSLPADTTVASSQGTSVSSHSFSR